MWPGSLGTASLIFGNFAKNLKRMSQIYLAIAVSIKNDMKNNSRYRNV